eukprot:3290366-Rhodomonas_salina.1
MSRSRQRLVDIASGSCDGEVRIWDLAHGVAKWHAKGHSGFVKGVAWSHDGEHIWTCGDDKLIKMWDRDPENESEDSEIAPLQTILGQHAFLGIDHHWKEPLVASCGVDVQIWDPQRSDPVHTLTWGSESVSCVRFNPVQIPPLPPASSTRDAVSGTDRAPHAPRRSGSSSHQQHPTGSFPVERQALNTTALLARTVRRLHSEATSKQSQPP